MFLSAIVMTAHSVTDAVTKPFERPGQHLLVTPGPAVAGPGGCVELLPVGGGGGGQGPTRNRSGPQLRGVNMHII